MPVIKLMQGSHDKNPIYQIFEQAEYDENRCHSEVQMERWRVAGYEIFAVCNCDNPFMLATKIGG